MPLAAKGAAQGSADRLGDAGAAVIGDLTSLAKLIIDRSEISSAGWPQLARLTKLKSLQLFSKNLTDSNLQTLKPLPLNELLVGTTGLTPAAVRIVADNWPELEILEINADILISESSTHLAKLSHLHKLTITGKAGNEQLQLVSKMQQLRFLSVAGSVNLSDAGLVHLHGMTALEKINLIRTNVTAAGVARLQAALPNCEIKWKGDDTIEFGDPMGL